MEVDGGVNDGATSLSDVTVGQLVNYRLVAQLARPLPAHNDSAVGDGAVSGDMSAIDPGVDGIGTARFNVYELAGDGIQVDLSPVSLVGGNGSASWTGAGSQAGVQVTRSNGFADLANVRGVGPTGVYAGRGAGAEITIATGSFVVSRITGNSGQVRMTYLDGAGAFADSAFPSQAPGTLRYNGGTSTAVASAADADPLYAFVGLTLNSTADVTGPRVVAVSPADNASAVGALTQFLLTFSEPIQGLSAGSVTVTGPGGDVAVTITQQSATTVAVNFGPFANLPPGGYTLTVSPAGVLDLAGNPIDQNGNGTAGEPTDAFVSHYVVLAPPPAAGADLEPTSVTGPATLLPGRKNKATVRIADTGDKAVKGKVTVALYLTTDGTIADGARSIAAVTAPVNLKPGASKAVPLSFATPPGFADGTYRYVAAINTDRRVTEADFTNDAAAGNAVSYEAPFIDLHVTKVAAPASASAAKKTRVSVTVTNSGNVAAKGRAVLSLLRAVDFGAGAAPVLSTGASVSLEPKASKTFKLSIRPGTVPAGLPPELLAAKVQWGGAPADRDPGNDLFSSGARIAFT